VRSTIVSIAQSQRGVSSPGSSYCNPYSAYWGDGSSGCVSGWRSNYWCADFAAWVWRQAGVNFTYGWAGSDINAYSASFYSWGLATGNWHALSSGYQPQPGDVAVYGGLSWGGAGGHVGIYVSGPAGAPTVVNGDWGYPGFADVYEESNESNTGPGGGSLDGYVSPPNQPGNTVGPSGGGPSSGGAPGTGGPGPVGTNGYQLAFQANTHELIAFGAAATALTGQGMMPGTSPSVTALAGGGYEMAFQANTGNLIVFGSGGNINTQQGMKAGTSPSIAGSPGGGFQVAFQANTGNLYTFNSSSGAANLQQGMDNNTSPSITALAGGGYEMAFQANTGNLIVFGSGGNINTQQGMKAETSPAIAASPSGGFEAAFQANTGNLYTFNSSSGAANLQQGMDNNTSPSITP
jgi:CHAP domain